MSDVTRDSIARALKDRAEYRLQSKGSVYDAVYVFSEKIKRVSVVGKYPDPNKRHVPDKCVLGARHARCNFLVLVDAYRTGGNDQEDDWILLYRVDLQKLCADSDGTLDFLTLMAKDGVSTAYPAEDDSPDITWTFDIVLPNEEKLTDEDSEVVDSDDVSVGLAIMGYVKPTQGTAHPLVPDALFINETWLRGGPVITVTRSYHKVAPVAAQGKIGWALQGEYAGFDLLTWTYETAHGDYTAPLVGSACTITGHSDKKVIKPPDVVISNGLNRKVTVTYGLLPGPLIEQEVRGEGAAGHVMQYTQRRAVEDVFAVVPHLSFQVVEHNGYSKIWTWSVVGNKPTLTGHRVDSATGIVIPTSSQVVSYGTAGGRVSVTGDFTEVSPLNPHYSIATSDKNLGLATKQKLHGSELDSETGTVTPMWQQLVPAGTPGKDVGSNGEYRTVDPINIDWSVMTSRRVSGYTSGNSRSWEASEAYPWPDVMTSLQIWNYEGQLGYNFGLKSYSGPCRVRITETWTLNEPGNVNVTVMRPTSMRFASPQGTITLPECLHPFQRFQYDDGAGFTLFYNWLATNFQDWPATVVTQPSVRRYPGGGFLRTVKTFFRP